VPRVDDRLVDGRNVTRRRARVAVGTPAQWSIVTGLPAAVCSSAVMADQPDVGAAAAGE